MSEPTTTAVRTTPTRKTPIHHAHTAHNTARQVLRTVYLPNERADALVLMVESLSSQLEEHKNLSKQHIKTIIDEFKEREGNFISRINEDHETIEKYSKRCEAVEKKWRDSVQLQSEAMHKLQVGERAHAERQVKHKKESGESFAVVFHVVIDFFPCSPLHFSRRLTFAT